MAVYVISSIVKEGTLVKVYLDRPNPVTFDMTTGVMTSFTKRHIQKFPVGEVIFTPENDVQRLLLNALRSTGCVNEMLHKLEMFTAYPELLHNILYCCDLPSECPKGFMKWIKDNGKMLTEKSLSEYKILKQYEKLTKEEREIYDLILGNENAPLRSAFTRQWYFDMSPELRKKFIQITKTSIKSINWYLARDLEDFINRVILGRFWNRGEARPENYVELLDGNRTYRQNIENLQALARQAWETQILGNENKIRPITELSTDKYLIIVPSTLEDFTREGQMQRNCVGHFYHQSIARGENFIYFIRLKSNPEQSYITNRFNMNCGYTAETRMVCNRSNTDSEALKLIKEIDEKIKELLNIDNT